MTAEPQSIPNTTSFIPSDNELNRLLASVEPEDNHPRVKRFNYLNTSFVAVGRRPGDSGELLAQESRFARSAATLIDPSTRVAVSPRPLRANHELLLLPEVTGPTLHESLTEVSTLHDTIRSAGRVAAVIHEADIVESRVSRNEEPTIPPLTTEQWAHTPDAVISLFNSSAFRASTARAALDRHRRRPASVFVHGDYKPDNIIVTPGTTGDVLQVIDWELAGHGRPEDDIAAMAAGMVVCRVVAHLGADGKAGIQKTARLLEQAGDDALEFLSLLLDGYRTLRTPDFSGPALADAFAIRLISRAQGLATVHGSVTALVRTIAGLAGGLLESLDRAGTMFTEYLELATYGLEENT